MKGEVQLRSHRQSYKKRTSHESERHCLRVRHPSFPIMNVMLEWGNNPKGPTGRFVSEHSQFYACHPWCEGPILERITVKTSPSQNVP